jgi:formiminoglutamate deiminase
MRSVQLWFERALLPQGWARDVRIKIAKGHIAALETGVPKSENDEAHAVAVPGLCNLHSHAFQRGMAGLAETKGPSNDSFWTWREIMYRFVERLAPEDCEAIAAMAYAEMLEAGFTRVGEFHYLHHAPDGTPYADPAEMAARIAAAAGETGIGLTLLPVFYAHSGFGGQAPKPTQRRFLNDLDAYARLVEASRRAVKPLGDAVVGVAPHSLRAVTAQELTELAKFHGPVHIHVAEQMREVEDCIAWSGQRPVEWLLGHAPVDARWCLVHATHMTEDETRLLAKSGAVAGLCPITEANLGDGLFPLRDFLGSGGRFGVGSDSNVLIDATEELRLLEYGQRLARRERNVAPDKEGASTGATLFHAALAGGRQALGVSESADLVSLDIEHPALAGRDGDALLDGWIFAARAGAVDCVWRQGRKVVRRGRHRTREAIVERYRLVLAKVLG